MSAGQFACKLHVPTPLVIVTVVPAMVHDPEAVIVAVVVALVVAETMNCELKYANTGAPVKVMVGVAWVMLNAVALGLDLQAVQGVWPQPFRTLQQTFPGDLEATLFQLTTVRGDLVRQLLSIRHV